MKVHDTVLTAILVKGGTGNIMEALRWDTKLFDQGFALANEMQNLDQVKLLYSNFNKNLIVVELTLVGVSKAKELLP
jgi:hypothetical protein